MDARGMHYDFKTKLNKIDSQKNRGLKVPEIDWVLNEAQEVFIKIVAEPRLGKRLGFEFNQRTIDDLRTIVVNQKIADGIVLSKFDSGSYVGTFPDNYWFYANARILADKTVCTDKILKVKIRQHDDDAENSPFDRSSFEWRVANVRFFSEGALVFANDFVPKKLVLDYLKKPRLIHNAQDWIDGKYELEGQMLTGSQSCELPETVHRDIVDVAVAITAGNLDLRSFQLKQNKLNITS